MFTTLSVTQTQENSGSEELAPMLEMGVIEESMSAWCIWVNEVLIGLAWLAFYNTGFDYWLLAAFIVSRVKGQDDLLHPV